MDHPALLYSDLQGFLEVMVQYVGAGIENEEVVFVAARGDYLPALRAELGNLSAAQARFADTYEWHPHPASRLRAFHELITDEIGRGATRFRLAGEPVWPQGPPEAVREWQRYESVLNEVLAPFPVSLLCLYDVTHLDEAVIEIASHTHPFVHHDGIGEPSEVFERPEEFLQSRNPEPSAPPPWAPHLMSVFDLTTARRFLSDQADGTGTDPERVSDLCVAANEILTNAIVHADGAGVWAWSEGDQLICQIEDRGVGIDDPLAGYRPPPTDSQGGRGLWMARQLVDLLQITHGPRGTVVRLYITAH